MTICIKSPSAPKQRFRMWELKDSSIKFYPKYNYQKTIEINSVVLDPKKEVRFKITRPSPYGERYKLFVIDKNTFEVKT